MMYVYIQQKSMVSGCPFNTWKGNLYQKNVYLTNDVQIEQQRIF